MKPRSPSEPQEPNVDAEAATVLRVGSGTRPKGEPDDELAPPTQRFARVSAEGSVSHGGAIDRLVRAERHLFAQAWDLRELMPDAARDEAGAQLVEPPEPSQSCPLQ